MRITKYGHCCLLIEESGLRILTDPGSWTAESSFSSDIHAVLITHEHADHLHISSLKTVLRNNPKCKVITNSAVARMLEAEKLSYTLLEEGASLTERGVLIEAFGSQHASMSLTAPPPQNTGYFIANRLFYPGDAFTDPQKPVEILALPSAGPWMKVLEAVEYALKLKPKVCFPVHDAVTTIPQTHNRVISAHLIPQGIGYCVPVLNQSQDF